MAGINVRSREEVQRSIVALLVTEKPSWNIPISKIEFTYRDAEGERIPYKALGYPTLIDFLKSIQQIHLVQRDGQYFINFLGTEKTKHVSELIAKQKTTPKSPYGRSRSTVRYRAPGCIPRGYFQRSQSEIHAPIRPLIPPDYSRLHTDVLDIIHRSPSGISKNTIIQKVRESRPGFFDIGCLHDILNRLGGRVSVQDNMIYPVTSTRANGHVNAQSDHVDWNPNGVQLPKKPVNVKNFETERREDFTDDIGDFEFSNDDGHGQNDVQNGGNQCEKPNSESHEAMDSVVNERLRFRLDKLILNRPNGIWCAELANIYYEEYKRTLEWEELGFNSLSDLVLQLPDIFHCVQPVPTGDFRLYHVTKKDQANQEMPRRPTLASVYQVYRDPDDDESPLPNERLPSETINHLIPHGVVRLGETIGQIPVSSFNQQAKGYEEVVVCDAFTPSFFWIHLRRKIPKLEALMEKLNAFYESQGNAYCVPLILLEKGLNIATKFYGSWHRGIVTAVDTDANTTTTVLFYDYGTVHKYPANEMYFLHNSFSALPAQAIPCGLYNVKPPEDSPTRGPDGKPRWSIETSRLFVQRVHDRPLIAICGKECENNSLLLDLTDTSSDEDVNIAEWLVQNKLAAHGSTGELIDVNDMSNYIEDYDFAAAQEQKNEVPKQEESTKETNVQINQTIMAFLEIVKSRLSERGLQLKALVSVLKQLKSKEIDRAMIDMINLQLMDQLEEQIAEDTEKFCSAPSTNVYDVFLPQDCFFSDDDDRIDGILSSVATNATLRQEQEQEQELNTENPEVSPENHETNAENVNFVDDDDNGTLEPLSEIEIDDQELFVSDEECSVFTVYDLPDTNPFKYDVISAATSYADLQVKIPPPIPPRTKRLSSLLKPSDSAAPGVDNVLQNNGVDDHQVNEDMKTPEEESKPPQFPPPQLPPRNPKRTVLKHFLESNGLNSSEPTAKPQDEEVPQVKKFPDCLQIDLEKCPVFIFFQDDSGWMTTDQFRIAFTKFSDNFCINKLLIERKDETCCKVVDSKDDPEFFGLIEEKLRSIGGDFQKECSCFYLIPINNVLFKMLRAFNIVSQEDIRNMREEKGSSNPILRECSTLINSYNDFIRNNL